MNSDKSNEKTSGIKSLLIKCLIIPVIILITPQIETIWMNHVNHCETIVNEPPKNGPLNVRGGPGMSYPPFDELKNGTTITVHEYKDGWIRISVPVEGSIPVKGWVYNTKTLVQTDCPHVTQWVRKLNFDFLF